MRHATVPRRGRSWGYSPLSSTPVELQDCSSVRPRLERHVCPKPARKPCVSQACPKSDPSLPGYSAATNVQFSTGVDTSRLFERCGHLQNPRTPEPQNPCVSRWGFPVVLPSRCAPQKHLCPQASPVGESCVSPGESTQARPSLDAKPGWDARLQEDVCPQPRCRNVCVPSLDAQPRCQSEVVHARRPCTDASRVRLVCRRTLPKVGVPMCSESGCPDVLSRCALRCAWSVGVPMCFLQNPRTPEPLCVPLCFPVVLPSRCAPQKHVCPQASPVGESCVSPGESHRLDPG
jgi:hypothetical protein